MHWLVIGIESCSVVSKEECCVLDSSVMINEDIVSWVCIKHEADALPTKIVKLGKIHSGVKWKLTQPTTG